MHVAPGPPLYQYGADLVRVHSGIAVTLDIRVKYLGHDAMGNRDYGLGLRRQEGWLVMRTNVILDGVGHGIDGDVADSRRSCGHLKALFPFPTCFVQLQSRQDDKFMVPSMIGIVKALGMSGKTVNGEHRAFLEVEQAERDRLRAEMYSDAVI